MKTALPSRTVLSSPVKHSFACPCTTMCCLAVKFSDNRICYNYVTFCSPTRRLHCCVKRLRAGCCQVERVVLNLLPQGLRRYHLILQLRRFLCHRPSTLTRKVLGRSTFIAAEAGTRSPQCADRIIGTVTIHESLWPRRRSRTRSPCRARPRRHSWSRRWSHTWRGTSRRCRRSCRGWSNRWR